MVENMQQSRRQKRGRGRTGDDAGRLAAGGGGGGGGGGDGEEEDKAVEVRRQFRQHKVKGSGAAGGAGQGDKVKNLLSSVF